MLELTSILKNPVNLVLLLLVLLVIYTGLDCPNRSQRGGGFGSDNSQEITNLHKEISNTVNDTFIANTKRCQSTAEVLQEMNIKCSISAEKRRDLEDSKNLCVQMAHDAAANSRELQNDITAILLAKPLLSTEEFKAILDNKASAEASIANGKKDAIDSCMKAYETGIVCKFSDIGQDQSVSFKAECDFSDEQAATFKTSLGSEITRKVNNDNDSLGKAVEALAEGVGSAFSDNSVSVTVKDEIENNLTNIFTSEDLTEMFNSLSAQQVMNLEGEGGSQFSAIKQVSMVDMMGKLLSKNEKYVGVMNEIVNKTVDEVTNTSRGLTDITGQIADTVQHVSTEIGETARTGIETIGNMQIAIVIVVIALVVGLAIFMQGAPAVAKSVGEARRMG